MKAIINYRFILAIIFFVSSFEITQAAYTIKVDTAAVYKKNKTKIHVEDAPLKRNKLASWSLVLAAGGFLFAFLPFVSTLSPFMLVGSIVTGIIALGQIRKNKQKGSGLAIAGLIISGVSILAAFAVLLVLLSIFG